MDSGLDLTLPRQVQRLGAALTVAGAASAAGASPADGASMASPRATASSVAKTIKKRRMGGLSAGLFMSSEIGDGEFAGD